MMTQTNNTLKYDPISHLIGGTAVSGTGDRMEVINPADGTVIGSLPLDGAEILSQAVDAATAAQKKWGAMTLRSRAEVFYNYRELLKKHRQKLGEMVAEESGKIIGEALAEIDKSIEVVEFACSMTQIASGEALEVSLGVECRIDRIPVGVVASITPFNFPSMVPHWTIPNALVLGNAMILKPSELVPFSAMRIAELLQQAGLPDGVFNVVHGGREMVEAICDHPGIPVISFVGSTKVAKIVYRRASANLKNVLAMGGAKNHLIVLPDAHPEMTAENVVASMTGCAGQRCMAASVMLAVGDADAIVQRIVDHAKTLSVGTDMGSVITQAAKERIESYIADAEKDGAKILLDGRGCVVTGNENGFYVGPTIIDRVQADHRIAKEEVFGPVLSIIRAKNIDEAIAVENASGYGNAAAVFTQSGGLAKQVAKRMSAGMIGVNIGVPVPREPFSFGGINDSKFGVTDITGRSSIEFWTRSKKTTIKWNPEDRTGWMS